MVITMKKLLVTTMAVLFLITSAVAQEKPAPATESEFAPDPDFQKAWDMIYRALDEDSESSESDVRMNEAPEKPDDIRRVSKEETDGKSAESGKGPDHRPPGWDKGEKKGWDGGNAPPGLQESRGKGRQNRGGNGNRNGAGRGRGNH